MDSKPVLPMNRPFAEMGYNSSGLNIVPERLLLATRQPSTHYPLASGAPSFDPLRATCQLATNHLQHTAQHLATPPASHLPSFCAAPGDPLRSIRRLPASHLPASSPRDARQPIASHPPSRRKPSAISLRVIRWHPAGICWHEPMPLTARRTNRRRKQEP